MSPRSFAQRCENMKDMRAHLVAAMLISGLFAAACSQDPEPEPTATPSADASTFSAQVASSDLAAGSEEAVQIGVFSSSDTDGLQLLSFGTIDVAFSYLGADGSSSPQDGPATTATFVAAPGSGSASTADGPELTSPAEMAGVYVTPDIDFPDPGYWNATVTASVSGDPISLEAAFTVFDEHRIPAPGDEALATENLTLDSKAPAAAVDSRAAGVEKVPDPELHDITIAEALRQGRPALVQFATPAYCTSEFCGPTVEAQEELAAEYGDVAEFVHVEIWRDYEQSVVNEAAAEWLQLPEGNLTEPWLYLIDADGTIVERWGPLFDLDDVRASLDTLPR